MQIIYGIHPVVEALRIGGKIEKVILLKGGKPGGVREILEITARRKIPVVFREREHLDTTAGTSHHQGVVCICGEYRYAGMDEVLSDCKSRKNALILILDGITDPQNLGSLIRTALCFGASGVIIPENRAASITPAVIKASAGAVMHLPVVRVVNISRIIDNLKEEGFWIYGADATRGKSLHSPDHSTYTGLVMGSEGKGIRPLVRKKCDFLISIPMTAIISSLNVSVSGGIILYEMTRNWNSLKVQEKRG
ncbi:MAG: 23S rRNA (guanosine(2251)-2'-O)-methyltransferase RlmB [Thermodesulfobacteriota bacterium]|nr:23S rRNA (guanosine(2251)-2'-O)-methyltransferase RlmB [Thermodesulfobacteriota bacterium]